LTKIFFSLGGSRHLAWVGEEEKERETAQSAAKKGQSYTTVDRGNNWDLEEISTTTQDDYGREGKNKVNCGLRRSEKKGGVQTQVELERGQCQKKLLQIQE